MNVPTHSPWLKRLPPALYKLGAQAWIDHEYPRHLFIETTAACNLACAYCPREHLNTHMDFALFQAVIDEASRYGARSFSLHLFGEPLLYPRWQEAVAYIKAKNRHHTILLTTNGTALNANVDAVVRSGIDLVLWTWRPEAKFSQEAKEQLKRWGKFRVRFIAEVTPKEAYAEWADWPNVEGRVLHNYGGQIDLTKWSQSNAPHPFHEAMAPSTPFHSASMALPMRWPCYHLWLAPAVAWNGNLLLCCADPHHKEVLGRFPEQRVHDIWTGPRLQAIRQSHLEGNYRGICAGCDVWKQYPDLFFNFQKLK